MLVLSRQVFGMFAHKITTRILHMFGAFELLKQKFAFSSRSAVVLT